MIHSVASIMLHQLRVIKSNLDKYGTPDPEKELKSGLCAYMPSRPYQAGTTRQESFNRSQGRNELKRQLFREWPEYSGDVVYPVPSPVQGESAEHVFDRHSPRDHWDISKQYGAARMRLIKFMIEELEKHVQAE